MVEEISKIETSIERIGPINLAAAEEYKLEEERNSEIDTQMSELNCKGRLRKLIWNQEQNLKIHWIS